MAKAVLREPSIAGVITGGITGPVVKRAIANGARVLEIRVDTFARRDCEYLAESFKKLKKLSDLPILLTIRSKKEGGAIRMGDRERLELFKALIPFADMVDIELSSSGIVKNVLEFAQGKGKKVIISYHNFQTTPGAAALQEIIGKGRTLGGDVIKIAAFAKTRAELRRLAKLLLDNEKLIVIAMGGIGAPSRVFFPLLGSLLTYGSVTASTAPGQLSLKELGRTLGYYGL